MSAIEETVRAYFDALDSSAPKAAAAVFSDDGVIMPHEMASLYGPDAIRTTFDSLFQTVQIHCKSVHFDRMADHGSWAIAETHSDEIVTVLADGTPNPCRFRELFVLTMTDDGWRIAEYMFNSATPPTRQPR